MALIMLSCIPSLKDVAYAYEKLSAVSKYFIITASFGNVHGVYKSGAVTLTSMILKNIKPM